MAPLTRHVPPPRIIGARRRGKKWVTLVGPLQSLTTIIFQTILYSRYISRTERKGALSRVNKISPGTLLS